MKVEVKYEAELPEIEHTEEELVAFLRFETGDNGVLDGNNPFRRERLKPIFGTFEYEYTDVDESLIIEE